MGCAMGAAVSPVISSAATSAVGVAMCLAVRATVGCNVSAAMAGLVRTWGGEPSFARDYESRQMKKLTP